MLSIIKSRLIAAVLIMVTVFLSGCATNLFPGGPTPAGIIMTNVKGPAQNLTVATDKDAQSRRVGTASVSAFAGLFAFGDASVDSAMKAGGITKVHHVDHQVNSLLLGLWLKNTTIVHGE